MNPTSKDGRSDGKMKKFIKIIKFCALSVLTGVLVGAVGACFARLLTFVTDVRHGSPWLVLLLPFGAIVTTILYKVSKMQDHGGTNEILGCIEEKKPVRTMAAPLIFVCSAISHLLGASTGREGAALQLGGAGAEAVCNVLKLKDEERNIALISGMGAVFAGLFATPLTAAFFVLEFKAKPKKIALNFLPCLISAIIAAKVSALLGVHPEVIPLTTVDPLSVLTILKIVVLAVGISLLGYVLCFAFHNSHKWATKLVKNAFVRSILFAVVIVILTAIVGDMRYNGSGVELIFAAAEGKVFWYDFLLKLVFTSITIMAGLKGGEIVPTFCIGATFGCVVGGLLGLDVGLCTALGLVGLFCCAANSPVAGVFLGVEMFGVAALPYYVIICLLLWPLSTKHGLFINRLFKPINFKKLIKSN